MVQFKEITAVRERKFEYQHRRIELPVLIRAKPGSKRYNNWMLKNFWMVDYHVHFRDKEKALRLSLELEEVFKCNRTDPRISELVEELWKLRAKKSYEFDAPETWAHFAYQMMEYAGGFHVSKRIVEELESYSGNVLEAMCGHQSYFRELPGRTVTALDYCEESLERYLFPHRRRIQCDLNQIGDSVRLDFFTDNQFDAISICFGFKYPENIGALGEEFCRILKPGGILSFIENPTHGFKELCKRNFSPRKSLKLFKNRGYKKGCVRWMDMHRNGTPHALGDFYHMELIK